MRGSGQLVRLGRMRLRAEPRARGLTRPIPYGRTIRLASLADGSVVSVRGDVVEAVAAVGPNAPAGTGFRVIDRDTGRVALHPGPRPDHRDGSAFLWTEAK